MKRPAQYHCDIFDRAMLIYMQIALGLDLQVEESMAREAFQHVIEERNPRLCLAAPRPVELERDHTEVSRVFVELRAALRLGWRNLCD